MPLEPKYVERARRYLKGTVNYGLMQNGNSKDEILRGFADIDWACDVDTRRSTSGYVCQIINNNASSCSKQPATAGKLPNEAEYVALRSSCQEIILRRRLPADIGMLQKGSSCTFLRQPRCY